MPPKKAQKSKASASASGKKASKLAQSLSLSAHEEAEIREAYELFPGSVHQAFTALGITPSEEMLDVLEPDDDDDDDENQVVPWERFLEVAALAKKHGDVGEEVEETFRLFTSGEEITLQDLRRVMGDLKEELSEQQLRDMMEEAKGAQGKVDIEAFEGLMRRAGVL